jgi:hypothetical protein
VTQLSRQALDALDDAFRSRLIAVLPTAVSPDEATAGIYAQLEGIINQRGGVEENLLGAAEMVLSDFQDRVARDIKRGWPPSRAGRSEEDSGADLMLPETAIVNDELHLWYGDRESPALALDPIPLSILTGA